MSVNNKIHRLAFLRKRHKIIGEKLTVDTILKTVDSVIETADESHKIITI